MSEAQADRFRLDLLARDLDLSTVKSILGFCHACWQWAVTKQIVTASPWVEVQKRVKVPPKQKPKPFNKEEIKKIVDGFRSHKYFSHYTEFVGFRLDTGCRIAEAAGLKFEHISDDCSQAWIGETYSRREWKPVKRNEARWLNLPKRAKQIIEKRVAQASDPNAVVFPGPRGAPINECPQASHTFDYVAFSAKRNCKATAQDYWDDNP